MKILSRGQTLQQNSTLRQKILRNLKLNKIYEKSIELIWYSSNTNMFEKYEWFVFIRNLYHNIMNEMKSYSNHTIVMYL